MILCDFIRLTFIDKQKIFVDIKSLFYTVLKQFKASFENVIFMFFTDASCERFKVNK